MKHLAILTLHFSLLTLHSSAAVPLRWTVETSRAQPATFEAYQGETLAFEASLQSAGKPLELSGIAALYWQTNGMGSAYWETTAAVNSNLLSAVFTPEMDVGAKVYNCFIGIPGTVYHAAFQLRLRPSPGAEPNTLHLPVPVIDFAKVRVLNPPWGSGGGGVDTNAVRDIIRDEITPTTNSLYTTLNDSIDVKRDKDDLAVYEKVGVGNDWVWTSDDPDLLNALETNGIKPKRVDNDSVGYHFWYTSSAFGDWSHTGEWDTSYGVDAHIVKFKYENPVLSKFYVTATATRSYKLDPVSPADFLAKVSQIPTEAEKAAWNAKADEGTGANQIVRGEFDGNTYSVRVAESVNADEASHASLAEQANIVDWNGVEHKPTTLAGYGITDGATKTELAGYLSLTGGYLKGPIYFDAGGRIYTDQGGISVNTHQGLNVYGGGSIVLESNESLTDFDNNPIISATNPAFSNAVLAVGLNIDTNSVAVINEIASTFGGFPIEGTATTVGGLLAALAAAIAWLKKNKVQTLKLNDNSVETSADGGVAKLDAFFTESNSLLTATIDARLPYPLYTVPSTGLLKDRAINTTSLASVTVPDNFTDLLIRASVASSLSVTMPETVATKYGDTFPGEAGEYLITITKTGAAEAYVRTIKLEEVANA